MSYGGSVNKSKKSSGEVGQNAEIENLFYSGALFVAKTRAFETMVTIMIANERFIIPRMEIQLEGCVKSGRNILIGLLMAMYTL